MRSAKSVVSMVGTCFFDLSKASGIVAAAPLAFHCGTPAGLLVSSHSFLNRLSKKWLLHFVAPLRVRADVGRIAGAVGLAERVPAGDQRDGLFVVHRHAEECLADVF